MNGKVAIVTGASSGIGLSVARLWAERGGRVALVARTAAVLERTAAELGADRALAVPLDVKDLGSLVDVPRRVKAHFGRLDVVVNNAGLNHRGPVERWRPEELVEIVTTNLSAPIALTRAALEHIETDGSIVQVASLAALVPVPEEAAYSASKAGLRAFTRAAAFDVEPRGIHLGCVCPGPVDTGFLGDLEQVPDIVLSQPMLSADDVARAVLRCIDERLEEVALPARSARLATMAYLMPAFAKKIRPALEKRGARNKRALIAARRRSVS